MNEVIDFIKEFNQGAMATTVPNFVPSDKLKELNDYYDSLPQADYGVVISREGKDIVDINYRKCRSRYITIDDKQPSIMKWLNDRVCALAYEVNKSRYEYEIYYEPINKSNIAFYMFCEYDVQDKFEYHLDWGGTRQSSLRKLSVTIQVTNSNEYEGGDLEIFSGYGPFKTSRAAGAISFFPSIFYHRVTPITKGKRRSIVAWFRGDKPYR